jgi:hypothetical protein
MVPPTVFPTWEEFLIIYRSGVGERVTYAAADSAFKPIQTFANFWKKGKSFPAHDR